MSQIPVILFTASPMIKEKMEELQDPYLGMLIKPVSLADLKAGIERYIG